MWKGDNRSLHDTGTCVRKGKCQEVELWEAGGARHCICLSLAATLSFQKLSKMVIKVGKQPKRASSLCTLLLLGFKLLLNFPPQLINKSYQECNRKKYVKLEDFSKCLCKAHNIAKAFRNWNKGKLLLACDFLACFCNEGRIFLPVTLD